MVYFERAKVPVLSNYQVTRQSQSGLTETQRDTLIAAFEAGCFTVPRESSLSEFAEQQNASHQAMSERIRRGVYNLIEQTLITDVRTDQEDE